MTIVAIWCRHTGDNVIGIGQNIPWHVSSDFKRFRRITEGGIVLAGERTYESFPNRTLPNRKIFVLTFNPAYEVSNKENHFVITGVDALKNVDEPIYLSGGASVYKAFMTGVFELMPDVVVDCVYQGDLNADLKGQKVDITPCVDALKEKYEQISKDYLEDNIITRVFVKKGDFVDQAVIKHILSAIENKGENK